MLPALGRKNRYFCITRPRRFGKTVMANMVGAFFEKTNKAGLFDGLDISRVNDYKNYLNKYDVIYIDFSRTPESCSSYQKYISRIIGGLKDDILNQFSDLSLDSGKSIWDILQEVNEKKKNKFIFVMDEWDAVFHMTYVSDEERKEYLLFLKSLLKDQIYVELAYMTGVLPIAKYSGGSELNMFVEYDMVISEKFSEYFGFLDTEVDALYSIYQKETMAQKFSREDLRIWYDGYYTAKGERLYNPRSVVLALTDNQLRNYWTSSGPYDEIFYYIRNNIDDVRDDLALMVSGECVAAYIGQYAAGSMEEILEFAHNTEAPVLSYNSETELSAVVNLCYLSARNKYRVEREDKAGKGFVDFIFYPERRNSDCIILELKVNSTPDEAIKQIKNKNHALCFEGKLGEAPKYTGRILLVGISYDKDTKVHKCKVEAV